MNPDQEPKDIDPITFQLANGRKVRVVADQMWQHKNADGRTRYADFVFTVRFYSNDEVMSSAMEMLFDFHSGHQYSVEGLHEAWEWLKAVINDRNLHDYDDLDDLVSDFEEILTKCSASHPDCLDHIRETAGETKPIEINDRHNPYFEDNFRSENFQ